MHTHQLATLNMFEMYKNKINIHILQRNYILDQHKEKLFFLSLIVYLLNTNVLNKACFNSLLFENLMLFKSKFILTC